MTTDLDALTGLAGEIRSIYWFSSLGEPLTDTERDDVTAYLTGLGFTGLDIETVTSWGAAAEAIQDPAWDPAWWDGEERLRKALTVKAEGAHVEGALYEALSAIAQIANDAVHGAAAVAAARAGVADATLIRVAAGAALQAAHQASLAVAAGAGDDHPFQAKMRLFAAGHWPLTVVGNRFLIF